MGWSGGTHVFDKVAEKILEDCNLDYPRRLVIFTALVDALQDCDWDTEDESLERWKSDRAVVGAFRNNGVRAQESSPQ